MLEHTTREGHCSVAAQQLRRVEPSLGAFASHSSSVHHLLVSQGLLISSSGDKTTRAYSLSVRRRFLSSSLMLLQPNVFHNSELTLQMNEKFPILSRCVQSKEREAEFTGHTKTVNAAVVSSIPYLSPRLFTGSSDQTIRCYDLKVQNMEI